MPVIRRMCLLLCVSVILPGCGGQPANKATLPDKPVALPDPKTRIQLGPGTNAPSKSRKFEGVSTGGKQR